VIAQALHAAEVRNLEHFGYGIKGFALSMIEAAIELSGGQIQGQEIQAIVDFAREMLDAPIQLLEHAQETVASLSLSHQLMLITKGDLLDQETKIARSHLADYFAHVEIVSQKTSAVYEAILARHHIDPHRFLMVGNSLKSDILPIVAIGGQAVYIPHPLTWAHETVVDTADGKQKRYSELEHIGFLPDLVSRLSSD
jgi:putative hydrolase of the HAD superfamily